MSLLGDDNSDRTVVISSLNKKIKTSAWFKKISKYLEISEIQPVYSNQLKDWIKDEAKNMDLLLSEEGINLIASRNEENLLSAYQELKFLKCLDQKHTDYEFVKDIPVGGLIYVKTKPEICEKRVIIRNRKGTKPI